MHTKGTVWHFTDYGTSSGTVWDSEANAVALVGTAICGSKIPREKAIARAHLIAAAPELLDALRECVTNFNFTRLVMDPKSRKLAEGLIDGYRKIIAKATGGAQ